VDDGKGTLLVCFLGDPSAGSAELPRVVLEAGRGEVWEVAISRGPRRLIRLLGLPRAAPLAGLSGPGSANRLAEALAAPPPQRPVAEVRSYLHRSRSQTDRVMRGLRDELEAQRLEGHLHRARGWIGLRDGTSDVALLFAAVRDERWEEASRVLAIVAPDDPGAAVLLDDEDWSVEARAHIADAVAQAKLNFDPAVQAAPSRPAHLESVNRRAGDDEEEVLEGEIVEEPSTAVILAGPREVTPWPGRRRRLRWTVAVVVLLLLLVGAAAGAHALMESTPEPSPLQLSIERAGPWPAGDDPLFGRSAEIANLTREIPFGAPMAARTGDTLLIGLRLNVVKGSRLRHQPFEVSTSVYLSSPVEASWSAGFDGPSMPQGNGSGSGTIVGLRPDDRIRMVPGSTVLLDDQMRPIRHLPDMPLDVELDHPYRVPRLRPGRLYYLVWRIQIVPAPDSAAGQVSRTASVHCNHLGRNDSINTEARLGDTLECSASLTNWGPDPLHDVRLRLSWHPQVPQQLNLVPTVTAPDAAPRKAELFPGLLDIEPPWPKTNLEYVPGSNRLETRKDALVSNPPGDPTKGGILVDELPPGSKNLRTVVFRMRLVPGQALPRQTRNQG
jgi:hypothetical protein